MRAAQGRRCRLAGCSALSFIGSGLRRRLDARVLLHAPGQRTQAPDDPSLSGPRSGSPGLRRVLPIRFGNVPAVLDAIEQLLIARPFEKSSWLHAMTGAREETL